MKKMFLLTTMVLGVMIFAQKPIFTTAKVKSATVYYSGAELTETATVILPTGTSEIVVKNISNAVNENTIQIAVPSTVTVLSSQFTTNYISEYEIDEKSPAIKKVKDSINLVEKRLKEIRNSIDTDTQTIALLDKNNQVYGEDNGLSVVELTKLVEFYKAKRNELQNGIDAQHIKYDEFNELLQKLNSKLEINTQKEEKISQGKLVIQVMNDVAGSVNLDINYITNNAYWTPFYDLRADNVKDPINLSYKAKVSQTTGIDWKKVKLTLSNGNPNQSNQQPVINPWFLTYNNYSYRDFDDSGYFDRKKSEIIGSVSEVKEKDFNKGIDAYTNIIESQLNTSFDISIPYDILSNGKPHSVTLKELKLPATYKYYSVPKQEKDVFLLAELKDYASYNLLPGEANIIFENLNVGKTFINPNQTQDTLNLSMGRDKNISINRVKVADKSGTKFLSAYKEQTFTYDIIVRNNKKEDVTITIKDQYPISSDKDITIVLQDKDGADENKETGILTWDLKLKPNETRKLRLSYVVKYPKDQIIPNL